MPRTPTERSSARRFLFRAIPLAVLTAASGVLLLALPEEPPPPLSEDIFEEIAPNKFQVKANLRGAKVVIPGRPHPFPFRPGSAAYREKITRRVTYRVSTNTRGWRGEAVTATAGAGVTRVACIGDSITFGHGVNDAQAYPAVLQRLLSARGRYEVINASNIGADSARAVEILREKVLGLGPGVVAACVGVNDIAHRFYELGRSYNVPHQDRVFGEIFSELRHKLEEMIQLCRERGVRLILMSPPATSFFPFPHRERLSRATREAASRHRIPFIDLQQIFHQQESKEGLVLVFKDKEQVLLRARGGMLSAIFTIAVPANRDFYIMDHVYGFLDREGISQRLSIDECHPNAEGHRLIARLLAEEVLTASPMP